MAQCYNGRMLSLRRSLKRIDHGIRHAAVLVSASYHPARRELTQEARDLARRLPSILDQPLPEALTGLTPPPAAASPLDPKTIRQIVDAMTAFGAGRPLGLCLRRSLLRFYFLRRAGVPVTIHFGARRIGDAVGGHAWLTLDGQPYHEQPENYQRYVLMFSFPQKAIGDHYSLNDG